MSRQLTIREEQFRELKDGRLVGWLCDYLRSCYPDKMRRLGSEASTGLVRQLVAKARRYSLSRPEDVRKYVHVGFLLGGDFDTAPEYGWTREILTDPDLEDPGWRAQTLEEAAVEFLCPPPAEDPSL